MSTKSTDASFLLVVYNLEDLYHEQ